MSSEKISIILIIYALMSPWFCQASDNTMEKNSPLKVYLPREVLINGDAVSLGQVGVIRGKESLVAKASKIALGRISIPGQEIVIDRSMILSRLACNGIPASEVILTGAEKTTVKQQQQIITGSELVEQALIFLKNNSPNSSICQFEPMRLPADLVIPGTIANTKFSPCLMPAPAENQVKVRIGALADGSRLEDREVTFRLKYNHRTVVTTVDIPAGVVLSPENVRIENTVSDYPEPADWKPPYGLVARRNLPANSAIHQNMVGSIKPEVIIERNQTVLICVQRSGLLVTAIGRAKENGRAGECIKVQNVDSQRIILAKVKEDGTVEPAF